ncbi:MAG: type IIL restriction-modification enzyme MmeI [Lysobacterales bacterium]
MISALNDGGFSRSLAKSSRAAHTKLARYIATVQTSKHRFFVFLDAEILPDDKLIAIGSDDAFLLGVLSSQVHADWALAAGATLEDRPVYNKSTCFDPFPFPAATDAQRARIRDLGEQLDAHRKRQQALHPELTLTGMYNVLDKLRAGDPLTAKERTIHEQGLVSVLRQLHDESRPSPLLDAYGWNDLPPRLRLAAGRQQHCCFSLLLVRRRNTAPPAPRASSDAASRADAARARSTKRSSNGLVALTPRHVHGVEGSNAD